MDTVLDKNLIHRVAVGDIPRRSAGRWPDKEALVEYRGGSRNSLTFDRFNRACCSFARGIRGLGLSKGDRVAVICLNSTEFVISMFGLAKGGFVSVPVNPGLDPRELAYVLNHSESKVLIIDDVFVPFLANHLNKMPNIKHYISIPVSGGQASEPFIDFHEFIKGLDDSEVEDVIIEDRDIVQIMYTSGTTAMPKGVTISNLNVYFTALQNTIDLQINSKAVITAMMPIFHCAQHALLTTALVACARIVVIRGFDPERLMKTIQNEKVTWMFALPMMYRGMLDHPVIDNYDLSSLETCLYAMTPMDRRTLSDARKRINATFYLATGQTEAYPGTNYFNPDWFSGKEGNVWGRSLSAYDTAVMDDAGNLLPVGKVGEIVWRGPGVMEGYFKDKEATEQAGKFGWHHSGDQGYMDEDGMLVFIDRKKDIIKTGGENVPSIRVETVIMAHPKVESAAVIGLPHQRWIEAVTAVVVPKKDSGLTEEELIQWCKQELGGFQVPKSIIFTDNLPRTSTGKIKKHELRKQFNDYYGESK
ncbi:AMP-binding protein [Desulfotruncus alcoholivorax]|uniref:AMP-binding protein n=1 Tax=Desulfotruncus alcoholivorax TaxID=265477 RepID=UPI000427C50E|nr:AMP-binding protein [Desulfotruncus alcoholivorax]